MKIKSDLCKRIFAIWVVFVISFVFCVPTIYAAEKVSVKTGKYYTLKNVGTGRYLNVYGNQNKNNANVDIYDADGTSGQDFKFTLIDKSKNTYTLTPRCATGRRVNVYSESAYNKANVCLWSKTNHSTQCWIPEKVSGGYILRSANNTSYVLTATGSKNSSNVNIQKYSSGNKKQIWTSNAFSSGSDNKPVTNKTGSSVTANTIKNQISNTYQQSKSAAGVRSFDGLCGTYVYYQLRVLGIADYGRDSDCNGNGNQWYNSVKSGTTSTGWKKEKFSGGANCLANLVKQKGNNLQNIVISYPYQYGYSYSNPGAGHVIFIHAIINGTVYYSECFACRGKSEGSVLTYSVAEFDKAFTNSYGKANGAIWFHK